MIRAFVLTNHKGGVGKSTSATNIALGTAGLLRQSGASNPQVLLVDTQSCGYVKHWTMRPVRQFQTPQDSWSGRWKSPGDSWISVEVARTRNLSILWLTWVANMQPLSIVDPTGAPYCPPERLRSCSRVDPRVVQHVPQLATCPRWVSDRITRLTL